MEYYVSYSEDEELKQLWPIKVRADTGHPFTPVDLLDRSPL
jgi:hypothetical protein